MGAIVFFPLLFSLRPTFQGKKSIKTNILEEAFINSLSNLIDSSPFLFLVQAWETVD